MCENAKIVDFNTTDNLTQNRNKVYKNLTKSKKVMT